jgi:hypothetical protein
MKKKIYIAGKVTGENREACIAKFKKAQQEIEALGHEAVNPIEVVGDWEASWADAMKKCIRALVDSDGIFLLRDFHKSTGAMMERSLAYDLKIPRFFSIRRLKCKEWSN